MKKIITLLLILLSCSCSDLSCLRYGGFLLKEGRYAEAYSYLKETAELSPSKEAQTALKECELKWSARLFKKAQNQIKKRNEEKAFELIMKANDIYPSAQTTDVFISMDNRLRKLFLGRAELKILLKKEQWEAAFHKAEQLLYLDPFDSDILEAAKESKTRCLYENIAEAKGHLNSGQIDMAYSDLKKAGQIINSFISSNIDMPKVEQPLQAALDPGIEILVTALDLNELPLQKQTIFRFLSLSNQVKAALECNELIIECKEALSEKNLSKAFTCMKKAKALRSNIADLPVRIKLTEKQMLKTSESILQAAFFSGNTAKCIKVFKQINIGKLPLQTEKFSTYEKKIKKLLTNTIHKQIAKGLAGNALLLIKSSEGLFPSLLYRMGKQARFKFIDSLPGIKIIGFGRQETTAWLREANIPISTKGDFLTIKADKPELKTQRLKPSYGLESKRIPDGLQSQPYSGRIKLLKELSFAQNQKSEIATSLSSSCNPWEKDFFEMQNEFWEKRYNNLEKQIKRMPHVIYNFKWRTKQQKISYYYLKAELTQKFTFPQAKSNPAKTEVLTVEHTYTAKISNNENPYRAGLFPSEINVLSDLKPLLKKKLLSHIYNLLDIAFKAEMEKASELAGEGNNKNAMELLCQIYAVSMKNTAISLKAKALLSQTWTNKTLTTLKQPTGSLTDFADHTLPPPE